MRRLRKVGLEYLNRRDCQMETAKPMADLLPGLLNGTDGTEQPERSTDLVALIDLVALPKRLDNRMLEMVRHIAKSPALRDEPCDDEHIAKCLRSLNTLPRRADDDLNGDLRVALFRRKLRHIPATAWSFIVETALGRCDWFPTIAECLRIVAEWPQVGVGDERRKQAAHLMQRELNARLDEAVMSLAKRDMAQAEIDAIPEQAKMVAAEKGYLWRWPDGRYTVRIDIDTLAPDEAEKVREANRAMHAEWKLIEAEQAEQAEAERSAAV